MQAQKKKPRQRNRPKNKVNRLGEQESEHQFQENDGKQAQTVPLSTAQNQLVTQALYESHETIRLMQQKMRANFLRQQSQQQNIHQENDNSFKESDSRYLKETNVQPKTDSTTNIKSQSDNPDKLNDIPESNSLREETQSFINSLTNPKKLKINKNQENQNKQEQQTGHPGAEPDEKHAFIANLQKQMEQVMANGNPDLPQTILGNLQKLLNQAPVSDIESSDEEDEYIEYVYKPRQYFLSTLCNFCNVDLCEKGTTKKLLPCKRCQLTYYCSTEHMKSDEKHRQLCYALRQIADSNGGHVFYKCGDFSSEQFRSYRIVTVRKAEGIINRSLTPTEQEIILFPRICSDPRCREHRSNKLMDCEKCGQTSLSEKVKKYLINAIWSVHTLEMIQNLAFDDEVAYCRSNANHFSKSHQRWCEAYRLFKELIIFQTRFGRLDPSLPAKILKDLPGACSNTRQILRKLNFDIKEPCEYAALSQISTGPLTAWYALKLCAGLKKSSGVLTIHLIGAELEFEVNALHKWELFFLHITPAIKELNIVFVGPELNPRNISFEQLKKTRCCRACRKSERTVNYSFDCRLYHVYCNASHFIKPDLICFFNPGLYRATGYQLEDTWPETILAAAQLKCPVVVTSYTEYEAPLDMSRFVQECNRHLNVALPPIVNPFASEKPERNFVSDDEAPLMFKNYYCFVVE